MRRESPVPAGRSAEAPEKAPGEATNAGIRDVPAIGNRIGLAPNQEPTVSRTPAAASATTLNGPVRIRERNDAGPSVKGHWATTAAIQVVLDASQEVALPARTPRNGTITHSC